VLAMRVRAKGLSQTVYPYRRRSLVTRVYSKAYYRRIFAPTSLS